MKVNSPKLIKKKILYDVDPLQFITAAKQEIESVVNLGYYNKIETKVFFIMQIYHSVLSS